MTTSKPALGGASLRDRIGGGKSFTIKNVLTGKDGIEVSIPNIIVAIVVSLVVIASVVAGVVFIVPWAQDSSAKGDIQTVQSAQQIYFARVAPTSYGTAAQLVTSKAILASDKNVAIKANNNDYCIGTVSATKTYYWLTSGTTTIVSGTSASTLAVGGGIPTINGLACPTVAQIDAVVNAPSLPVELGGVTATSPVIP